ncbi:hypothetical protein BSN82_04730 [Acinetobacter baylyi]|uniref:Uncharacterized protein n=1 Tax=Acinetobacter baylyi (strain ATCC 33305 / BD413 / ADP1) TaxID=62977 RepID=Q6FEA9_ACIAD|nr:hypothetical protein BSL88_06475 [Acinetobacter baylyi]MAK30613.1 hypothetical protein [Acinetobacter sp.]CAG67599.1 hypothetical protein ACIAD0684 [Acinetobacter baylyi ADP1]KAF2373665.1 hypothetical protein BSL67_10730 [Acinetobacter baylyi]KAF2376730.1 hypothetical protein BSN81_12610 [Acinetobacter baylyi]
MFSLIVPLAYRFTLANFLNKSEVFSTTQRFLFEMIDIRLIGDKAADQYEICYTLDQFISLPGSSCPSLI